MFDDLDLFSRSQELQEIKANGVFFASKTAHQFFHAYISDQLPTEGQWFKKVQISYLDLAQGERMELLVEFHESL